MFDNGSQTPPLRRFTAPQREQKAKHELSPQRSTAQDINSCYSTLNCVKSEGLAPGRWAGGRGSCHPLPTRSDGHGPVLSAAPQSAVPALENVLVLGLKQLHFSPSRYTKGGRISSFGYSRVQVVLSVHVSEGLPVASRG